MTQYTYFKEPELEETAYTHGFKAGSFSYLEDGEIDFHDLYWYYDGKIDEGHPKGSDYDHNSTYVNIQDVKFVGVKGISEIYAKGFYPSNRAVSAWKKIRYDNFLYPDTNMMYPSTNFQTSADIRMNVATYDFLYNASVTDSVVDIWDSTGWTNKTGARRIDYEKTALIRGDAKIDNHLVAYNLSYPGGPFENDWLPCCYSATQPEVKNKYSAAVLLPKKILPEEKLFSPNCVNNCKDVCNKSCREEFIRREENGIAVDPNEKLACYGQCVKECTNFTCVEGDCPGFECIYTYYNDRERTYLAPEPPVQLAKMNLIVWINEINHEPFNEKQQSPEDLVQVISNITAGDKVEYKIEINHDDWNPLRDVNVTSTLPECLEFDTGYGSWIKFSGQRERAMIDYRLSSDGRMIRWHIPEIPPGSAAYIFYLVDVDSGRGSVLENEVTADGRFGELGRLAHGEAKPEITVAEVS